MLQMDLKRKHWLAALPKLPQDVLYQAMLAQMRSESMFGGEASESEVKAAANYFSIAY